MLFTDLPNDMIDKIMGYMDLKTKCCFALTNKELQKMFFHENSQLQKSLEKDINQHAQLMNICISNKNFSLQDNLIDRSSLLRLFFGKGCMFCQKPRVRKIYQPFNLRSCKECICERTISEYNLKNIYEININDFMTYNFPYQSVDFYNIYNTGNRYLHLRFFWKSSVEKLYTGRPLSEIQQEIREKERKREEEEKRKASELEQKRNDRKKIVLEMARKKLKILKQENEKNEENEQNEENEENEENELSESDLNYSITFRNYSTHLRGNPNEKTFNEKWPQIIIEIKDGIIKEKLLKERFESEKREIEYYKKKEKIRKEFFEYFEEFQENKKLSCKLCQKSKHFSSHGFFDHFLHCHIKRNNIQNWDINYIINQVNII